MTKSIISAVIIFLIILVGCDTDNEVERDEYLRQRAIYASNMRFEFQNSHGRHFLPESWLSAITPYVTDITFVHSELELPEYSNYILFGWPSYATIGLVDYFNEHFYDQIEESNIMYPLTVEDVVDNWEDVHELWNSLLNADIIMINNDRYDRYGSLVEYERKAIDHDLRRIWSLEGRLEILNSMIEGEDLSEFGLTWPINEADLEEHVQAVESLFLELLTLEEREQIWELTSE